MSGTPASSADVFRTLREFQRVTARYAFHRMYGAEEPTTRFLVADEVGLGKTMVAKGVIAQVVEHLQSIGDRRIDIVYICSNGAIARQNLRKLNIAGDEAIVQADRFTILAQEIPRLRERQVNLIAVTPGTSFDLGSSVGKFPERALLYAVLQRVWGEAAMQGSGAKRVFYLGITDDRQAGRRLTERAKGFNLAPELVSRFREQIGEMNRVRVDRGEPTLKVAFNRLVRAFQYKDGFDGADRRARNAFIGELRRGLAVVAIEALQPDLVILDEFQRFRSLLHPDDDSWANQIAHDLFNFSEHPDGRRTRTLLLSATPYRPYSTTEQTGEESHFEDFVLTARFLLNSEDAAEGLRYDLRDLRHSLLVLDRDGGASAAAACRRVADRLCPVMCRTERLASTPDRSGMLHQEIPTVVLQPSDVDGFLAIATAAKALGREDVIEYWKSGPYLLNFMEGYALKRALEDRLETGEDLEALRDLVRHGRGLLSWHDVNRYQEIDPANARLRALVEDVCDRGMWRLLWLPPSLPYYSADGPFDDPAARAFTKRLVFSSWNLVPKVISAMLSFEAERRVFLAASEESSRRYDDYQRRSGRLLDFRTEGRRPEAMANLTAVIPFVELARVVSPRQLAADLGGAVEQPTLDDVRRLAVERVRTALAPLVPKGRRGGQVDQRWYWAAPLLMDRAANRRQATRWWTEDTVESVWTGGADDDGEPVNESSRFRRHLNLAETLFHDDWVNDLGRPPEDLAEVVADIGLGSPACAALRSLAGVAGREVGWDPDLLAGAARIAWGFRSLFSAPDATALVGSTTDPTVYWRAVLDYCAAGHLQAVLDEYLHMVKDWQGFSGREDDNLVSSLAEVANQALSLKSVSYFVDVPRANGSQTLELDRHSMRGRFAIRFGDQTIEGEQRQQRAERASQAFNSPFWPFVMSTTSIGQEGLDFHLYSHAIVHWNLPSNPVDLEQREGRVHRYKGHAIRKNVAYAVGDTAFQTGHGDPWTAMFDAATELVEDDDGELSPYWVFRPAGAPARIERHVPVLPLSRDAHRLQELLRAVATYRLSFGQPRQEELLRYLQGRLDADELAKVVATLRVDLSPCAVSKAEMVTSSRKGG